MPARRFHYDELRLQIARVGDAYRVHAGAETGEATSDFALPFSDVVLENFVLRMSPGRSVRRGHRSPDVALAQEFGGELFRALVHDEVRDVYRTALAQAERSGRGLRITLSLGNAPELMDVPWEYLFDAPNFLAVSSWTPIVRYLDLPRAQEPLAISLPLRILAMVSAPTDVASLDVERERAMLSEATRGLADAGLLEVTWLEDATLGALLREVRRTEYHVFHFIGHGVFDATSGSGALLLEDGKEHSRPSDGTELATILQDSSSLRLAVLNACEGARSSRVDPFTGVATTLVRHGMPAVVAMQFEITDSAAATFADGFYGAIALGFPVDAALAEGRKAIFAEGLALEWGTPVLFMRVEDGRLFDVDAPASAPEPADVIRPSAAPAPPPAAPPAPRAYPRPKPRVLVAAVAALAVMAAGIALLAGGGSSGPGRNALSGGARGIQQINTCCEPSGVAIGGGTVWIAARARNLLLPVRSQSPRRETGVELPGTPQAVAADSERVWVAAGDDGQLFRIDPRSGGLFPTADRIGGVGTLALGEGALWATNPDTGVVTKFDAQSGRKLGATPPIPDLTGAIAVGGGSIWVTSRTGADLTVRSRLLRIDPRTASVHATIKLPRSEGDGLAFGEGAAWVADTRFDHVIRVDPATNREVRRIAVPTGLTGPIAVGGGAVWAWNAVEGSLVTIDPARDAVASAPIAVVDGTDLPEESRMSADDQAVWLTQPDRDSVTRVGY